MPVFRSSDRLFIEAFPDGMAEKLYDFFDKIWRSRAFYKVFMARRAFNLNYAMMQRYQAERNPEYYTNTILSNNGLIASAEELASYYLEWGSLPRILIVDDILIHGRALSRLIHTLSESIAAFIRRKGVWVTKAEIRRQLISSVEIYVFTKKEDGILLDSEVRVHTEIRLPAFRIRELSQRISDYLQSSGIANTSYVLSSNVPAEYQEDFFEDFNKRDPETSFCYRGREQLIYCYNRKQFIQTIRIHCPDGYSRYGNIMTSLVLLDDVRKEDLDYICRRTAKWINRYLLADRIVEILNYDIEQLDCVKMQMLSFLLSIFSLADFCREQWDIDSDSLYRLFLWSDYKKIASNFGNDFRLNQELIELFEVISFDNLSGEWLYQEIGWNVSSSNMSEFPGYYSFRQVKLATYEKHIYNYAEKILFSCGMKAEEEAKKYLEADESYDANTVPKDLLEIQTYLDFMFQRSIAHITSSIGCMLGLIDSGIASIVEEAEESEQNGRFIKTVLKAGELATSVYVRRYSVFVPALALVERDFSWKGYNRKRVLENFIDYIQEYCYRTYGEIKEKDEQILKSLNKDKKELFQIYNGGQTFNEWNADLLTRGDRSHIIGNKSEEHFSKKEERLRKEHYLNCAVRFLNMN